MGKLELAIPSQLGSVYIGKVFSHIVGDELIVHLPYLNNKLDSGLWFISVPNGLQLFSPIVV